MSYTVLSVAYPLTLVGPDASGGSEQVLTTLDRKLTVAGHRSLVIAAEGSKIEGELIASPSHAGSLDEQIRRWGRRVHQRILLDTLNSYDVDVVHMHALDFHAYLPLSSVPVLATLHLPIDWYPAHIFRPHRGRVFLNCVSESQHRGCPNPNSAWMLPYVRNGIEVQTFDWQRKKEPFVLALGRICPEKGFHLALDAARRAGMRMILAGELFPYEHHVRYFKEEIAPRLDGDRQFIGPAGAEEKRRLLASAQALLVPSLVAETSSLVTMEALASGTPVIAFRTGAVPELVDDKVNGFLVGSVKEMAAAIGRAPGIRSGDCRLAAESKCSAEAMAERYFALYERLSARRKYAHRGVRAADAVSWLADVS